MNLERLRVVHGQQKRERRLVRAVVQRGPAEARSLRHSCLPRVAAPRAEGSLTYHLELDDRETQKMTVRRSAWGVGGLGSVARRGLR